MAPTDNVCFGIAPCLFALCGQYGGGGPLEQVAVSVDGAAAGKPVIGLPVASADNVMSAITLFSAPVSASAKISWSINGRELLTNHPFSELSPRVARARDFLDFCDSRRARVETALKLIESVLIYMKKSADPDTLRFARGLVGALEPVAAAINAQFVEITPTSTLMVLTNLPPSVAVRNLQIFGATGFRRAVGKPLILTEHRSGFWIVDMSLADLRRAHAVLWGAETIWTVTLAAAPVILPAALTQLIAAFGPHRVHAIQWLKHATGSVGRQDSRVVSGLRLMDAELAGHKNLSVSFSDDTKVGITASVRAANGALTIFGWYQDPHDLIDQISWVGPGGSLVGLKANLTHVRHHGVPRESKETGVSHPKVGFCASTSTPMPGLALGHEMFQVRLTSGASQTVLVAPAAKQPRIARDLLLSLPILPQDLDKVFDAGLGATLAGLQNAHVGGERVEKVVAVGGGPKRPRVSVIVPIYKNIAFLRAQYTGLAASSDVARMELIFVIDDDESGPKVEGELRVLHQLYGLACKIVFHTRNFGYAPAVNSGVKYARAPALLLLNSDVVAADGQAITDLLKVLRRSRKIGAVGPKLLFANGTIQHAGLAFDQDPRGHVFNRSLFKGYPADFPAANQANSPTALSAACLLVDRRAWDAVGGISEDYLVGDFEDTDFCLKLRAAGWSLRYEPSVTLHHFERQSIDMHQVHRTSCAEVYNRWRHQSRWFDGHAPAVPRCPSQVSKIDALAGRGA